MKPLVLYHKDCADGFGAALAAWLKFGWSSAEYCSIQYNTLKEELSDSINIDLLKAHVKSHIVTDRDIYILDFSIPQSALFFLAKLNPNNKIYWLDHHEASFLAYAKKLPSELKDERIKEEVDNVKIILDNLRSGARLAWTFFQPHSMPPILFRHLDDYDRWQFKIANTKNYMARLFSKKPFKFENWHWYIDNHIFDGSEYLAFCKEGALLNEQFDSQVFGILKNAKEVEIKYKDEIRKGWIVNCSSVFNNEVANTLAARDNTFGICWNVKSDGKITCSIRSIGDYSVREIAESFGGNGHKNAAGFSIDIERLKEWLKL